MLAPCSKLFNVIATFSINPTTRFSPRLEASAVPV